MTPREFISAIAPAAQACHRATGIAASLTIAQAALESGWGESKLTREANNLFGIKAHGWDGPTYEIQTAEYVGGEKVMESASFRRYESWAGSLADHAAFLRANRRYAPVFAETTGEGQMRAVAAAGYATDPRYADKLLQIAQSYRLFELDAPQDASEAPTAAPITESEPTLVKESKTMPAPIFAALLPSLISVVPELAKLFGSGSPTATRNARAVEILAEVAKTSTGAINEQAAVERIQADPQAREAFTGAVKERYWELSEAGSGGIGGARKADEARMASGKPIWSSATFIMGALMLPLVYMVAYSVTFQGDSWDAGVRASLATGIVSLVLGGLAGYYFGASRNAGVGTPMR